jgi:hypothetical protein
MMQHFVFVCDFWPGQAEPEQPKETKDKEAGEEGTAQFTIWGQGNEVYLNMCISICSGH